MGLRRAVGTDTGWGWVGSGLPVVCVYVCFFLRQHKHCCSFLLLKEVVWANFLDRLS